MANVTIRNWRGEQIIREAEMASTPLIAGKAAILADAMRAEVQEPYPPASAPGEFPHKRTGGLLANIVSGIVGPGHAMAGCDTPLALWLEFGTSRMEARPFIRPAVLNNRHQFSRVRMT